jgi:hypothetical protein
MKKKLIMLASILLLAGCLIFLQNYESRSFQMLNTVSEQLAEEIKNTRTQASDMDFSCLLCNEMRLPFDSNGKNFYISVDMNTREWEELSFQSGQEGYQLVFPKDLLQYDKQNYIAAGSGLPVIVYDEAQYAEYTLIFTGLPVIDLTTDVGIYQENIQGDVVFYDTNFSNHGIMQSKYKAHLRGNTSRMYPKKGYKLNLLKATASETLVKNQQSVFGMRKDDDWILYALYNDESKIRDRLSIDIWNAFGAKSVSDKAVYGTNLTYVELIADNSYCGLYGLMEPVDAKQLDLSTEDYLYKRKNPHGLRYEEFAKATDPYLEVNGFEIKEGEMNASAWEPIASLAYLVNETSAETFAEQVSSVMDQESAVRMWLFMQIITGHDQRAKNVYYVAKKEKEDYRFYFAPWDMDLTFGNVSVGEVNPLYTAFEAETFDDDIPWETADRLIFSNVNGAAEQMQQYYRELRQEVLSDENLEERITALDRLLRKSGAYQRDWERWPEGAHTRDCEALIDYAKKRMEFLDQALFDLENYD